ncbi:MAG: mandelate racemase/muconate lactonizing enzyme family protein [Arcticibacter sp.]
MKIEKIDIYRFSIRIEPFAIATGTMHFAQNVFIRVHAEGGLYGVGECSAFPMIVGETQETCLEMARNFASIWKGKDALDIESRLHDLDSFAAKNTTIKSAFDMALYDLAAKHAGLPLYRFLGGTKRAVETDMTIGIAQTQQMVDAALKYKGQGARVLKIKLGKDAAEDAARMKAIRKAVGEEMILRIDANQGWSFEDALYALKDMDRLNIQFCEQPMRTWYDDYLTLLRSESPVRIMADESCYNHHDARRLINSRSCDYLNIKLSKSGGIHEALKIHQLASDEGMPCMIGTMLESRIALSATLHLVYACPGITFFDLDSCLLGFLEDPVKDGLRYEGFFLDIDELPGIGADADEAFLEKCERWTI